MPHDILYEFEKFRLDPLQGVLLAPRGAIALNPLTCEVLRTFLNHPNDVLSFDFLIREAWGDTLASDETVSNESVTFQIRQLRRVLNDDARSPRFIQTLRKKGFKFLQAVRKIGRTNLAAQLFEKGRFFYHKSSPPDLHQAIDKFEKLIENNTDYTADAYAGIAESNVLLGTFAHQTMPASLAMEKARIAARKALLIDPEVPEAHAALASVAALYDRDWTSAQEHFTAALGLRSNPLAKPLVRAWYALCLAARQNGQQAIQEIEQARADFPTSPLIPALGARVAYVLRNPKLALQYCEESMTLDNKFYLTYVFKGHILRFLKDYGNALVCFRTGSDLAGRQNPVCLAEVAHAQALLGRREKATSILRDMETIASRHFVSQHPFALVHLGLGEKKNAINYLRRTLDEREAYVIFFATDPTYDDLRDDPEFSELVTRSKL